MDGRAGSGWRGRVLAKGRESQLGLFLALCTVIASMPACQTHRPAAARSDGADRYELVELQKHYRACVNEALELDALARSEASPKRSYRSYLSYRSYRPNLPKQQVPQFPQIEGYLESARTLERCERELGPHPRVELHDERLHAYALSVQNYLKGGDIAKARQNFARFREAFPRSDLSYPAGGSFVDSMSVLLGLAQLEPQRTRTPRQHGAAHPTQDISRKLHRELTRAAYWRHH